MDDVLMVKNNLLKKENELKERLERLALEESMLMGDLMQTYEAATHAWYSDAGTTKSALRRESLHLLQQVQMSLKKLEKGVYGKCDKCGHLIDDNRLKILPMVAVCTTCI
jgi:RNA polymerase-binding transcription factor DksA